MTDRRLFWICAILWLGLLLPGLTARYSFGWDSSQFDRAVSAFDIARHQPHPPGYPLWVLALRVLSPIVGNPNRAQVLLALLFTIAALWFFRDLAQDLLGDPAGLYATLLLAFSPLVCLNADSSQVYAVDLFLSCFSGWLARELCSGRTGRAVPGFAMAALVTGFRPSGALFMAPLWCFALWRCAVKKPLHAALGILAGAVCWLAWLVPTARLTGGFRALAALNHAQMADSFRKTSIFFGAPPAAHASMLTAVSLFFAIAVCAFIPSLAASRWPRPAARPSRKRPAWATAVFFFLWISPNLALLYLFHCSQPGYLLLSLPPLALWLAWLGRDSLRAPGWTCAGIAAALLASYFPYQLFIPAAATRRPYLLLRSTPHIASLIETSQRDIRTLIDAMPGRPEEKLIVCVRREFEAPNIRTVTYDFSDVSWVEPQPSGLTIFPPRHGGIPFRSVAWLCDGAGLPPALRAQHPDLRRIGGNALYSFWAALPAR